MLYLKKVFFEIHLFFFLTVLKYRAAVYRSYDRSTVPPKCKKGNKIVNAMFLFMLKKIIFLFAQLNVDF